MKSVGSGLLVVCLTLVCSPAAAEIELTITAGLRTGGDVTVSSPGPNPPVSASLNESLSYGFIVDSRLGTDTWFTALWSRQDSEFDLREGLITGTDTFGLAVDYIQAGAAYRPENRKQTLRPFVGMTAGLTWFNPDPAGFDSDLGFSLTIDAGAKLPISTAMAFRFEGRALMTLTHAAFSGACGPEACTFRLSGSGLFQFEFLVGLTFTF